MEVVCLSVYPRFTLEWLKLGPQTHIYLESVSPRVCQYVYHTPFCIKKKEKNCTFASEKNGATGLKIGATGLKIGMRTQFYYVNNMGVGLIWPHFILFVCKAKMLKRYF